MSDDARSYHHGDLPNALIAAATAIISQSGVESVSVREVARRAGVSPGAPFRHFPTRDALLAAVAAQAMERLAEAVRAEQAGTDHDPLGQIEAIGLAYLTWAQANPAHFRVVSQRTLVDLDGRSRRLNDEIRARMLALLTMAKSGGQIRRDVDVETVLLSCRALVYGLARMFVDGHFPEWRPEGDPSDWMKRSLAQFIRDLRRPGSEPAA